MHRLCALLLQWVNAARRPIFQFLSRAKAAWVKKSSRGPFKAPRSALISLMWQWIAARLLKTLSSRFYSAMKKGLLRALIVSIWVNSKRPIRGHYSLMRSANCRLKCKWNYCAFCKRAKSILSGQNELCLLMSASLARPTVIWPKPLNQGRSAKICITVLMSFQSKCRHCVSAAKILALYLSISSSALTRRSVWRLRAWRLRRWSFWKTMSGKEMFASSKIRFSARWFYQMANNYSHMTSRKFRDCRQLWRLCKMQGL